MIGNDKETSSQGEEEDFRNYVAPAPKTMGTFGDLLKKLNIKPKKR
jgi:hypothetical protein